MSRATIVRRLGRMIFFCLGMSLATGAGYAQSATGVVPYDVRLEPVDVSKPPFYGAPRLQSFVIAQSSSGNEWLLVGGRLNGFHGFAPPDANFPYANANTKIWVVDLDSAPHVSSYDVSRLPANLLPVRDQLSSTNMQGYQDGNTLYLTGGYGINYGGTGNLVTYSMLTAINVDRLIQAVSSGRAADVPGQISFSNDQTGRLQVTGGEMLKLGDYFYLVMGQSFNGQYMPCVAPSALTPPCQQVYTDQIRRFKITRDAAGNPIIDDNVNAPSYWAFQDAANFHRRDLNVTPTILADGTEGIAAYSGVFTPPDPNDPDANMPWRYPVYISASGTPHPTQTIRTHPADHSARVNATANNANAAVATPSPTAAPSPSASPTPTPTPVPPRTDYTFEQKMNSYASANVLIYDPARKSMYTTLFGGLGHYIYDYQTKTIVSAGGPPGLIPGPAVSPGPVFNDMVPYSNSVVTLARDAQGRTAEVVHDDPMTTNVNGRNVSAFIGAEMRFVPLPAMRNMLYGGTKEIYDLTKLTRATNFGYLYGGIRATPKPDFEDWQKYGQWNTKANDLIYRVIIAPARTGGRR